MQDGAGGKTRWVLSPKHKEEPREKSRMTVKGFKEPLNVEPTPYGLAQRPKD